MATQNPQSDEIIVVRRGELENFIASKLAPLAEGLELLTKLVIGLKPPAEGRLNRSDAAAYLGVTAKILERMSYESNKERPSKDRVIPCIKVGRQYLYEKEALEQYKKSLQSKDL